MEWIYLFFIAIKVAIIQSKFNQRFKVILEISYRYRDCNLQGDQRQENQGESGNLKVTFLNQRKSGKIDLFGIIREKSGNFILNQGKNQGISL